MGWDPGEGMRSLPRKAGGVPPRARGSSRDFSRELPLEVAEPRIRAQDLLVQPAIQDAFAEPPLLAQLHGGNPPLLRPLVDRLWLEPQVAGHFLDGQDLIVEFLAASAAVSAHGRLGCSGEVSPRGARIRCNNAVVSGGTWPAGRAPPPCRSWFTA